MRQLIWRTSARNDVAKIIEFIAARNPIAARRMRDMFDAAVQPLPEHPFLFRAGRVSGTRELVAHPNYIVIYRVTDTAVEIVTVVHARQQYP